MAALPPDVLKAFVRRRPRVNILLFWCTVWQRFQSPIFPPSPVTLRFAGSVGEKVPGAFHNSSLLTTGTRLGWGDERGVAEGLAAGNGNAHMRYQNTLILRSHRLWRCRTSGTHGIL